MISIQLGIQVHIPLQNNPLKPTETRVASFAKKAKHPPRYGGSAAGRYRQSTLSYVRIIKNITNPKCQIMEKHLVNLCVIPLIFLFSCQDNVELTDDQKATIVSEVEDLYDDAMSNLSKLDIDVWSTSWSKDGLLSVNSGTHYFSHYVEFRDSVEYWFSLRETQNVEILEKRVTVLASDLALLTSTTNWEIQFKDETELNTKALATILYKKETDGWKIIHLHESWR